MKTGLYGMIAEFRSADELLAATRHAHAQGYERIEAYSPLPIEGLAESIGMRRSCVPLATLLGGIVGGVSGYFMQWYAAVVSYPINVGGRPLHSWPMFIPVAFETTILFAALAAVVSMLWANGLPRLWHPVFNAPDFGLASRNRFFLCLRCDGEEAQVQGIEVFLASLAPIAVSEVPL